MASTDDGLESPAVTGHVIGHPTHQQETEIEQTLRATLAGLHTPPTDEQLTKSLDVLNQPNLVGSRDENNSYAVGIEERVVATLYARAMDSLLKQAVEADNEAQFWFDVERSRYNTLRFLVQSESLSDSKLCI